MWWAGYVVHLGDMRIAFKILIGNLKGKRPRVRSRCRWEDNIRVNLTEIGWKVVNWLRIGTGGELL